jgi:NADH:ubiquinone oxidoreductase subunit 2 (subunit N)
MATIVKAAAFIAFFTVFETQAKALGYSWGIILPIVIILTLLVGNITAVFQRSVKRMLAYSSIAQAGFMLFALYGKSEFATEGLQRVRQITTNDCIYYYYIPLFIGRDTYNGWVFRKILHVKRALCIRCWLMAINCSYTICCN